MAVVIGTTYKPFVLEAMFGDNRTSNFPTPVFFALSATMPTVGSGLSEPVDPGVYLRQSIANSTAQFPISGGQLSNAFIIQYAEASVNWGNIGFWGIMDAVTSGNLIVGDAFAGTLNVTAGMAPYLPVGLLTLAC